MTTDLLHRLDDVALRKQFGGGVVLRARTDVAERRVLDIEVGVERAELLRLEARVRRRDGKPLDVRAVLVKEGRRVLVDGLCDCPDAGICRHILAVLLAHRARLERAA